MGFLPTLLAIGAVLALPAAASAHEASPSQAPAGNVSLTGTLTEVHADDFKNRKARDEHWELSQGVRHYRLKPRGRVKLHAGTTVRVTGRRKGHTIKVRSMRASKKSRSRRGKRTARAAGYAPGGRKVAVVLAQFAGGTAAPTADSVKPRVFSNADSPNAFFKEESGGTTYLTGKVSADGDVFGPYTIPASSGCDYSTWESQARSAASAAGHDMTGYDHIVTVWPAATACSWSGMAGIGSGWADINTVGWQMESSMTHELGHDMGIHHAGTYNCTSGSTRVTLSSTCTTDEYGDPFDTMGCCGFKGHNSAGRKAKWGWLGADSAVTATSGSFLLAPMETPTAGSVQSLRIPRPSGDYYYLEFRQPFGFDAYSATSPVVNGVSVRLEGGYTTDMKSNLLDMTPSTATFSDAPLAGGQSYTASDINTTIYVDSVSALGASVRLVGNGSPPPPPPPPADTAAPAASVTPGNGSYVSGKSITVKGTGSDNTGVSRMELLIDGRQVASSTGASVSYSWSVRSASSGQHVLTARAYDAAGNLGSATSTVTK